MTLTVLAIIWLVLFILVWVPRASGFVLPATLFVLFLVATGVLK